MLLRRLTTAVVNQLRSRAWRVGFDPVRTYRPLWTLEDLATLHCAVAARTMELEPFERGGAQLKTVAVEIAFQQRLAPATGFDRDELVDELVELLEEVAREFAPGTVLADVPEATVSQARLANDAPFQADDMDEQNGFNASVIVVFQAVDEDESE